MRDEKGCSTGGAEPGTNAYTPLSHWWTSQACTSCFAFVIFPCGTLLIDRPCLRSFRGSTQMQASHTSCEPAALLHSCMPFAVLCYPGLCSPAAASAQPAGMQCVGCGIRCTRCAAVHASVLRLMLPASPLLLLLLLQSLSYKAASMSDVAQGSVSGGMLATLSKPMQRLSRSATPAVRRDKDV